MVTKFERFARSNRFHISSSQWPASGRSGGELIVVLYVGYIADPRNLLGCDLVLKIKKRRLDFGAKLCTACGAMMILLL
jgi:hypothetical protein